MWGLFCCSLFGQVSRSKASTCQSLIDHHGIKVVLLKANQGRHVSKESAKNCMVVDEGFLFFFQAVGDIFLGGGPAGR